MIHKHVNPISAHLEENNKIQNKQFTCAGLTTIGMIFVNVNCYVVFLFDTKVTSKKKPSTTHAHLYLCNAKTEMRMCRLV